MILEWFRSWCVNTATLSNQTLSCVNLTFIPILWLTSLGWKHQLTTRWRQQLHLLSCHSRLAQPKVCATKILKTQVLPTVVQEWRELTGCPWKPHPLLQREIFTCTAQHSPHWAQNNLWIPFLLWHLFYAHLLNLIQDGVCTLDLSLAQFSQWHLLQVNLIKI